VVVCYFVDEKGWDRSKAAWVIGSACFVLAVPSALANGASPIFSDFLGMGIDFLSLNNAIWGNYSLSIGAILLCVFVGWKWGLPNALDSLQASGHRLPAAPLFGFLVRYVCPAAIGTVLVYVIVTGNYF
jgi:neurotransmitter:Na+ symporter, NSS family